MDIEVYESCRYSSHSKCVDAQDQSKGVRMSSLLQSTVIRRVLSNTSWLASEKVLTMSVSLVLSIFLARSLGPETWGRLNYLLAIVAMLGPFTSLGLNAIITREVIKAPEYVDKIIATALIYRLMGGIVGALICTLVCLQIGSTNEEILLISCLLFASLFGAGQVVEFWFQAEMLNKYVASMRFSIFLLFALIKVSAVIMNVPFWQLIMIFAAELLLTGLGYVYLYVQKNQRLNFAKIDFHYGWNLLRQSMWLVLSGLAAVLYLKVDQIMLANMVSNEAVGIYSVAVKLSEVWFFFPAAFAASIFPVLLNARNTDQLRYQRDLQISCDALLGSALIVILTVTVLAPFLVPLLFGDQYIDSASVLTIHIWGSVFVFMRALASKWIISESLLPYSLWSHGLGAVINIALNLVMIPMFGIWGAAWATVISYFFSGYLCFWFFAKTKPMARVMTRSILFPFNWHKSFRTLSKR